LPDLAGTLPTSDLAGHPDLSHADLANAAGFCAGTPVAGTCVQTFFAPQAMCFSPTGACHAPPADPMGGSTWCWANDDVLKQKATVTSVTRTYKNGSDDCFTDTKTTTSISGSDVFTSGSITLQLNVATGAYECPNGAAGSIGPDLGGCAALQALINPATNLCGAGACPF
jgi:hypothetical protein